MNSVIGTLIVMGAFAGLLAALVFISDVLIPLVARAISDYREGR